MHSRRMVALDFSSPRKILAFLHFQMFQRSAVKMVERVLWLGRGARELLAPKEFNRQDVCRTEAKTAPKIMRAGTVKE